MEILSKTPKFELEMRMNRFATAMDAQHENWELCVVVGGLNMFYLTGTMCDGILLIKRNDSATLWVRRSYERALIESELDDIRAMRSFRDIAGEFESLPNTLYIDTANASLEWFGLFSKHMPFPNVLPIDNILLNIRAIKSEYELGFMRHAGAETDRIYREVLPTLLHDGISEVELGAELFSAFLRSGFHGVSRFSMRNVDSILGHVAFGDSTLYPSAFNGAAGINGLCAAVPVLGSHNRRLQSGDLVYLDISEGVSGYHVDKTLVLSYKTPQNENIIQAHMHCLELERMAASMLKPGAIPSEIYATVLKAVKEEYRDYFMGAKGRTVPFLGHGVGLFVDEMPVIAKNFNNPLEENMTIAIEPKISFDGAGMVGSENTYLVTKSGGLSLTGEPRELEVINTKH
ncbi:MAG: Xaa-Pro peptidase family protein [Oscillospiraceae bacterium]|nr:Xaa-Pro peptidase family protein [Oscillospiraceae bacterium]